MGYIQTHDSSLCGYAQEGYVTCLVCVYVPLSVSSDSSANIARFYAQKKVYTYRDILGFSRFITRGFSIKLSVRELAMARKSQ